MRERVSLRAVEQADLARLYEMQLDRLANQRAVAVPRKLHVFEGHWQSMLNDSEVVARAIEVDDVMSGHVTCFPMEGHTALGYWLDRSLWGRGIATQAVKLFLSEYPHRPLYAHVATSNVASLRVLEKSGFVVVSTHFALPAERHPACEETRLILV